MIKILLIAYLVTFYLSLPGFFSKAGYSAYKGLIPIYNVYILLEILNIKPLLLILISLGLIFLEDRMYFITLIFVFMPFMLADAYDKKLITGILGLCLPFIIFPAIAYGNSTYIYDMEDC
jgi:hypothetical protein